VDTQKPEINRRRFDRFLVDYPISYNLKESGQTDTGVAMNLSEGGLLASFFDRLSVGSELDLEMFYAFDLQFTSFNVEARIVWKDILETSEAIQYQYGIEFTNMGKEDKARLRKLLASMGSTTSYHSREATLL